MSDVVLVALISSAGLIAVAALQVRTNRKVKQIKNEVSNDHTTNLRDDLDGKHDDSQALISRLFNKLAVDLKADVAAVKHDVGGIRSDIRQLYKNDADAAERWHDLEITQPRRAYLRQPPEDS